ncbi:hypothetical protein [uncultured Fibrobacter sp.]|uniref:hypothetical protein n=1 Tax=uncultured Fibrobacter sp. TaxID=261512 RepID=UPI0025FC1E0D|nr:hypothetical protein [uncultured Fibrobacter sp.]
MLDSVKPLGPVELLDRPPELWDEAAPEDGCSVPPDVGVAEDVADEGSTEPEDFDVFSSELAGSDSSELETPPWWPASLETYSSPTYSNAPNDSSNSAW